MRHIELPSSGDAPQRLDHFLAGAIPGFSRSRLQRMIHDGQVWVGDSRAKKPGQLVEPGMLIRVDVPAPVPSALTPEMVHLDVVYEDDDLLVLNKPAGMVVHPGAGHASGTLANAALGHDPSMWGVGGEERPGIVHRLDKDTSGLIVMAKNDASLRSLQRQFQERRVAKTYLALVDGHPPSPQGRVEASIGRDPSHRKRMAIVPEGRGRPAISEYAVRERYALHSLLEVHPITGRTHQVRLHCAFLGCPVVGDSIYGRKKPTLAIPRHFLHAWKLEIRLPSEERARIFSVALPADLEHVLAELRQESARAAQPLRR